MPSPLDVLKAIMEGIPPGYIEPWDGVRPGKDRILRKLTEEEIRAHEELCSLEAELRASLRKSLRYIRLFESKRFLFKDRLQLSSEQAESAENRGYVLDLRKTEDGTPVLVEISADDLE